MPSSWPHKYSKEFLDKTIQAWQPSSKELLTYQDAEEITYNAVGLYRLLLKWSADAQVKPAQIPERNN